MWKLSDLIADIEDVEIPSTDTRSLPIQPDALEGWTLREKPNRYTRMIKFSDETKFNAFLIDVLELQSETQHHARITIQFPSVKVEVWTHDLEDVTEVDQEWCQKMNDILGDYQ